jgi:hypothetical protein
MTIAAFIGWFAVTQFGASPTLFQIVTILSSAGKKKGRFTLSMAASVMKTTAGFLL